MSPRRHDQLRGIGTSLKWGVISLPPQRERERIVIGVNDFGGAYPLLLANGGTITAPKSLFGKAELNVEIKLIPSSKHRWLTRG